MRKTAVLFLVLTAAALFCGALAAADEKPAPMKVVVEGEDDFKQPAETPVFIIKRAPEKKVSTADLKGLAAKSDLENEVMDSVISKMSDLEAEIKQQKFYNMIILAVLIILFGAVYFTRRKK